MTLTPTLDRIESKLPLIPRRLFRLKRAIIDTGIGMARSIMSASFESADRVERSARTATNTVVGQAKEQASASADVAESETSSLLGRATRSVKGDSSERLEEWTKAALYERAQELKVEGRSTMSKKQLITALRDV